MDKEAGVYAIRNIRNGKMYIGSSKNLNRRRRRHFTQLKLNKHHNSHLQSAYNNKSYFVFGVLKLCKPGKRLSLEQKYINHYKVYKDQYGYNMYKNVRHVPSGSDSYGAISCKIINPQGEVVQIECAKDHCEKHNLSKSLFSQVLNGYYYQCKGWRKYNKSEIGKRITVKEYGKNYKLLSPEGEIVYVDNVTKFCRNHSDLKLRSIYSLLSGDQNKHKGWRMYKPELVGVKEGKHHDKVYVLENLDTKKRIKGKYKELKKQGFHNTGLSNLYTGKRKTYKNHKIIKTL